MRGGEGGGNGGGGLVDFAWSAPGSGDEGEIVGDEKGEGWVLATSCHGVRKKAVDSALMVTGTAGSAGSARLIRPCLSTLLLCWNIISLALRRRGLGGSVAVVAEAEAVRCRQLEGSTGDSGIRDDLRQRDVLCCSPAFDYSKILISAAKRVTSIFVT